MSGPVEPGETESSEDGKSSRPTDEVRTPRRLVWALCAAVLLGGAATPALARRATPRLAAALAVCDGYVLSMDASGVRGRSHGADAWGFSVWIYEETAWPLRLGARSIGPDGIDDHGAGDDLVLTNGDIAVASGLYNAPVVGGLLAAALAWCLRSRLARAPRHSSRSREVVRALALALPPALLVLGALRAATWGDRNFGGDPLDALLDERVWPSLIVPPQVAFLLAYSALAFGLACGWRMSRRREADVSASA